MRRSVSHAATSPNGTPAMAPRTRPKIAVSTRSEPRGELVPASVPRAPIPNAIAAASGGPTSPPAAEKSRASENSNCAPELWANRRPAKQERSALSGAPMLRIVSHRVKEVNCSMKVSIPRSKLREKTRHPPPRLASTPNPESARPTPPWPPPNQNLAAANPASNVRISRKRTVPFPDAATPRKTQAQTSHRSQLVRWTLHPQTSTIQHVRVDHRRRHAAMP